MRPVGLRLVAAAGLVAGLVGPSGASSIVIETELTVRAVQRIDVLPGVIEAPRVRVADLDRGWLEFGESVRVEVSSNVAWELQVRRAFETGVPGALLARSTSGAEWTEVGTEWATLSSGVSGADGVPVLVDLRLEVDWLRGTPGNHEPRLEFRVQRREAT